MSDEEFCRLLGLSNGLEMQIAAKVRDITAQRCRLTKDLITPHSDTQVLNNRTLTGWDDIQFLMALEKDFGVVFAPDLQLPNFTLRRFFFFYRRPKPVNYGEWVKAVVRILTPVISQQLQSQQE